MAMGSDGGSWSLPDGSQVPVFLDLRPIYELLSPLYFEDPLVWTQIRPAVESALAEYEATFSWDPIPWSEFPSGIVLPPRELRTDDPADLIKTIVFHGPDFDRLKAVNKVRVLLNVKIAGSNGWWKGLGFNNEDPTIAGSEADGIQSTDILASPTDITFWKAKFVGVQ